MSPGADWLTQFPSQPPQSPLPRSLDDLALLVKDTTDDFAHLRHSYPDLFKPKLHQQPQTPAQHGIYHHIKMLVSPVSAHFRHLSAEKHKEGKQTFLHMEEIGLCQKASSLWASPFI